MLRALFFAALVLVVPGVSSGQTVSVLHIKVVLLDADRKVTPVPRHALLISDNPATATPRRVVTALDGTVDVRLRPGNYTVESDEPVAFQGKAYLWTQTLDVPAGRDTVLELTAGNAEIVPITSVPAVSSAPGAPAPPLADDPSFILPQWQDSVVALWTPTTRASGFVIDARGLVATNQRVIGTAASLEVQLTPAIKVAARVLVADSARDVAVLWIDPKAVASLRPVPLGCGQEPKPPAAIANGQELFTIGAPLREAKTMTSGTVSRVEAHALAFDLRLASGSAGGPVFTAGGSVVGITSPADDKDEVRRGNSRVVRAVDACDVVASAEQKMKDAAPPDGTRLPVEPVRPYPVDTLKDAAQRRGSSLNAYQLSASDFDVTFITPVLTYAAQYQSEQGRGSERSPLMDFGDWSEYVDEVPPVLLIRATPRLVEGFWTTVARQAAQTQGVNLPPIKRFKPGFARMRAFCGDAEVTPIHPFTIERRVSESDGIAEGLYVFDPGALGPQCGTVKLMLYSEKEPGKSVTRVVDPKVIQQIWQDFAPYRE